MKKLLYSYSQAPLASFMNAALLDIIRCAEVSEKYATEKENVQKKDNCTGKIDGGQVV